MGGDVEDDTFFFLLRRRRGLPQSDGATPGDGYLRRPKLDGAVKIGAICEKKMGGICGTMEGYISVMGGICGTMGGICGSIIYFQVMRMDGMVSVRDFRVS
jgi:hypothetical protein